MNAKLLFATIALCATPILAAAKTPMEVAVEQNACQGAAIVSAERLENRKIEVVCGAALPGDTVLPAEEVGEATNLVGLLAPILGLGAAGAAAAAGSSGSSSGTNGTN